MKKEYKSLLDEYNEFYFKYDVKGWFYTQYMALPIFVELDHYKNNHNTLIKYLE